jgi:hypothetical protein
MTDARAKDRYERDVEQLQEDVARVIRNVNEALEAGHLNELDVTYIFEALHRYEDGTKALLRDVYRQ